MSVYFCIRRHGEEGWYSCLSPLLSGLRVTALSIPAPEPKTESISIFGTHGILDYTEVDGKLYYSTRNISITVALLPGASFDYERFLSSFHGKTVDLVFSKTTNNGDFYYTGRLTVGERPKQHTERRLTLTLCADPFRYPVSGEAVVTLQRSAVSNLLLTDDYKPSGSDVFFIDSDNRATIFLEQPGKTEVALQLYAGNYSLLADECPRNAYFNVTGASCNKNSRTWIDFSMPQNGTLKMCFYNLGGGGAYIRGLSLVKDMPAAQTVINGDRACCPHFFPKLSKDAAILLNGERIGSFKAGTEWSPYFELKPGENTIAVIGETDGEEKISFEKAVLG